MCGLLVITTENTLNRSLITRISVELAAADEMFSVYRHCDIRSKFPVKQTAGIALGFDTVFGRR